jgi:hypothetical protein
MRSSFALENAAMKSKMLQQRVPLYVDSVSYAAPRISTVMVSRSASSGTQVRIYAQRIQMSNPTLLHPGLGHSTASPDLNTDAVA